MQPVNKLAAHTNFAKAYGLKPHHYKAADKDQLCGILSSVGFDSYLKYDHDLLYTYHPPASFEPVPVEYALTQSEGYGFYRASATQFLLRSNMYNVKSCHAIEAEGIAPGGNLAY